VGVLVGDRNQLLVNLFARLGSWPCAFMNPTRPRKRKEKVRVLFATRKHLP